MEAQPGTLKAHLRVIEARTEVFEAQSGAVEAHMELLKLTLEWYRLILKPCTSRQSVTVEADGF